MKRIIKELEKYTETYEIDLTLYGRNNHGAMISKDGINLTEIHQSKTIKNLLEEILEYLNRINSKKTQKKSEVYDLRDLSVNDIRTIIKKFGIKTLERATIGEKKMILSELLSEKGEYILKWTSEDPITYNLNGCKLEPIHYTYEVSTRQNIQLIKTETIT